MTSSPTFRYWRDPWCLGAGGLYLLQRVLMTGIVAMPAWWRGHATDLLLVPVGLPVWLWLERRVGWRRHDGMPTWREALFVLATWTFAAEVAAPLLFSTATADAWDAVAYLAGAAVALTVWRAP